MGHITSSLSEAGFAKLKAGKLAVHPQMSICDTVETMRKQEGRSISRSAVTSDRLLNTRPVPNVKQCQEAVALGKHLTPKAVDELDAQIKKAMEMKCTRIGPNRWSVTYKTAISDGSHARDDNARDIVTQ